MKLRDVAPSLRPRLAAFFLCLFACPTLTDSAPITVETTAWGPTEIEALQNAAMRSLHQNAETILGEEGYLANRINIEILLQKKKRAFLQTVNPKGNPTPHAEGGFNATCVAVIDAAKLAKELAALPPPVTVPDWVPGRAPITQDRPHAPPSEAKPGPIENLARVRNIGIVNLLPSPPQDGQVTPEQHTQAQRRVFMIMRLMAADQPFENFLNKAMTLGWNKASSDNLDWMLADDLYRAFVATDASGGLFKRGADDDEKVERFGKFVKEELPKIKKFCPPLPASVMVVSEGKLGEHQAEENIIPFEPELPIGWQPGKIYNGDDLSTSIELVYTKELDPPRGIPATQEKAHRIAQACPDGKVWLFTQMRIDELGTSESEYANVATLSLSIHPAGDLEKALHVFVETDAPPREPPKPVEPVGPQLPQTPKKGPEKTQPTEPPGPPTTPGQTPSPSQEVEQEAAPVFSKVTMQRIAIVVVAVGVIAGAYVVLNR